MPDPSTCGACGGQVKTWTFEGSIWVESDTRSQDVAHALVAASCLPIDPPEAPYPLCPLCFVGWLHNWLGIGEA